MAISGLTNNDSQFKNKRQTQMIQSVANVEEDIIDVSLLQLDDTLSDGNVSVLSLNLFDAESVFDSDTDVCVIFACFIFICSLGVF